MIDGPRPATAWGWVNRFSRFFALAGASCFALAVFFNVCFVLPMRRQLELEADFCGLKYAAKACFQLHSVCAELEKNEFKMNQAGNTLVSCQSLGRAGNDLKTLPLKFLYNHERVGWAVRQ